MTTKPAGGRVLVVVPADFDHLGGAGRGVANDSTDDEASPDDPTWEADDFVRGVPQHETAGGETHPTERSERGTLGDEETETEDGESIPPDDDWETEQVVDALTQQLSADIVVRCEDTAIEYIEELGPTLDCVVVLWENRPLIDKLIKKCAVPTIVFEPPVIGRIDEIVCGSDPVEELLKVVEIEVRNDHIQNDLQESNARLTALSHYAEDITACETVDEVAERTVEATIDALAFDYCVLHLVEGEQFVPRASTLPEPPGDPFSVSEGIAGRVLARGVSEIVTDMQADPDTFHKHDELHAILCVPIGDLGVIQVVSEECNAFDEQDREFVEILAGSTREALQRIEREVTLRKERDRLHAFFGDLPAPAVFVEQRDGEKVVEEVNRTFTEQFGEADPGTPLVSFANSDVEIDYFERAFETGTVTNGSVERERSEGERQRFALSVVPVSPPTTHECAYGIYVDEQTTNTLESLQ